VAVVADTHSAPHPRGLEHLAALAPDAILHAGDIGDLAVLEALARVAPVHAVRGNIDGTGDGLPDALSVDLSAGGAGLRLLLTHVGVAGPRLRADAARAARAAHATLVVCGHSHVPFIGLDRGLTVFNPGSLGPRRFQLPILFGVLELGARGLALRHVDAVTGLPWVPGLPP
jgi:putative phosphoesterase